MYLPTDIHAFDLCRCGGTHRSDFFLENIDVCDAALEHVMLALHVTEFDSEHTDFADAVGVLHLSSRQCRLLKFEFLVDQSQLVIAPNELRAQNIALV